MKNARSGGPTRPIKRRAILLGGLLAVLAGITQAPAETAGFKVIVSVSNPTSEVSRKQVSAMFLKKVPEWSNGAKVLPVDLKEGSPVRESFSLEVHGKNPNAIKSYWQQMIFSGRGVPPPEKNDDADILAYVQANAGAIGYVSASAPVGQVKLLRLNP